MKFFHHDLEVELNNTWWADANMADFVPEKKTYRIDYDKAKGKEVFVVRINEVGPVKRNPGTSIFNDGSDGEGSAKNRVVRILRWFVADVAIEPVEVALEPPGENYRYKLTHGAHRLYCSLAVGYSHVPAVKGFDWSTLDQ